MAAVEGERDHDITRRRSKFKFRTSPQRSQLDTVRSIVGGLIDAEGDQGAGTRYAAPIIAEPIVGVDDREP